MRGDGEMECVSVCWLQLERADLPRTRVLTILEIEPPPLPRPSSVHRQGSYYNCYFIFKEAL